MKIGLVLKIILSVSFIMFIFADLPDKPTVYLAGDSTMAQKKAEARPETGWGEKLPQFFNDQINFSNHARNGRSSKSFIKEGLWDSIYVHLKPGDFVLIQFGHNDESVEKGDRYSTPQEYKNNLIKYVNDAREKGATPILLTSIVRRSFNEDGTFYKTHGEYPDYVREVAEELDVPFIDHQKLSMAVISATGSEGSKKLYLQLEPGENENYPEGVTDNTHLSPLGAELIAKLAVSGIKELNIDLKNYLK